MNKFINLIRVVLKSNKFLYEYCANQYHNLRIFWFRLLSKFEGVNFFSYPVLSPELNANGYMSQYGQDKALEELGLLVESGVFVEVGSNHPVLNSNTYFLEHIYKWSGISIDAIDYSDAFLEFRKNTKFLNLAIDPDLQFLNIFQVEKVAGWEDQVSSVYNDITKHGRGFKSISKRVQAKPLSEVCKELEVIDILLLDVEGHEIKVLESLDWNRIRPSTILTENNGDYYPRKKLRHFLERRGYSLIARVGAVDEIYIDTYRKNV